MRHSEGKTTLKTLLAAARMGVKSAEKPVVSETCCRARSPVLLKTDLPGHIWSGGLGRVYHAQVHCFLGVKRAKVTAFNILRNFNRRSSGHNNGQKLIMEGNLG